MSCREVQASLVQYQLGELDKRESSFVEGHLDSGCNECRQLLNELTEGMDSLFECIPEAEMNSDFASAILRDAMQVPTCETPVTQTSVTNRKTLSSWMTDLALVLAATAAGFALAATLFSASKESDRTSQQVAAGAPNEQESAGPKDQVNQELAERRSMFGGIPKSAAPDLVSEFEAYNSFISLPVAKQETVGKLQVVGDPVAGQLHVFGSGFEQAPFGLDYVFFGSVDGVTLPLANAERDRFGMLRAISKMPAGNIEGGFFALVPNEFYQP